MLPSYFNCTYAGTLIKGDNFGATWVSEKLADKIVMNYEKMGISFARKGYFDKEEVSEFAKPEYFGKGMIRYHKLVGRWIQKAMFRSIAKKNGCTKPLDDRPYQ